VPARLRGGRTRLSEQAVGVVRALVDELNLATRDEVDELELRGAQLEHRLRLLEEQPQLPTPS
jgi:polyhydroxyalkanoate synthesis regulator phasin